MSTQKDYENFGKILVKKLRDENYSNYLKQSNSARSITLNEYYSLPKNSEYDPKLQKIDDDRFEFMNSLNDKQKEQLDKLILKTLDEASFNFLREVEESFYDNKSIGLTYKGNLVEDIYNEFLSGTFFGEYFIWINKFSKYGEYQY